MTHLFVHIQVLRTSVPSCAFCDALLLPTSFPSVAFCLSLYAFFCNAFSYDFHRLMTVKNWRKRRKMNNWWKRTQMMTQMKWCGQKLWYGISCLKQ